MNTDASGSGSPWLPLDPEQFDRIGRVHRSFFYQHLLGSLLIARVVSEGDDTAVVRIESDEDLELGRGDRYAYLQVKTTEDLLVLSDVGDVIVRFCKLRALHAQGNRSTSPRFVLVVAGLLGPELANAIGKPAGDRVRRKLEALASSASMTAAELLSMWETIEWITPGKELPLLSGVTLAANAPEMIEKIVAALASVPRLRSSPETAALALASSVNMIAGDIRAQITNRTLSLRECLALIDRVAVVLETLPDVPLDYIPPERPLDLLRSGRKVILVGASGAGKSSHVAWEAFRQGSAKPIYLKPRGTDEPAIVADLISQMVEGLGTALADDKKARSLATVLAAEERIATVVDAVPDGTQLIIDDAHRLPVANPAIRRLLGSLAARSGVTVALISQLVDQQGHPAAGRLQASSGGAFEVVDAPPWEAREVAIWCSLDGCPVSPELAVRASEACGHIPMAVINLTNLAKRRFEGNVALALEAVQIGEETSAQIALLEDVYTSMPVGARRAAGALSILGFAPTLAEVTRLIRDPAGLRVLFELRVARRSGHAGGDAVIELHDSFIEAIGRHLDADCPVDYRRALHERAADLIEDGLRAGKFSTERVLALYQNLLQAKRVREVVSLLTETDLSAQTLVRFGIGRALAVLVEEALAGATEPLDRFWLRDTLIFLAWARIETSQSVESLWIPHEREYAQLGDEAKREVRSAYFHKMMVLSGLRHDLPLAERAWRKLKAGTSEQPIQLIADYGLATIYYEEHRYEQVLRFCCRAIKAYCKLLGFGGFVDLWTEKREDIAAMITVEPALAHRWLEQLADWMDLAGRTLVQLGQWPLSMFSHALTLYSMAGAPTPLLRAAFAFADATLLDADDRVAPVALEVLKPVLAAVKEDGLHQYLLEATAWTALAAAKAGEKALAQRLLDSIRVYDTAGAQDIVQAAERRLLAAQPMRLPPDIDISGGPINARFMRALAGFEEY